MKILLAAGAVLLVVTAAVPFRAQASSTASAPHSSPMALMLAGPLAIVVSGPLSRSAASEPQVLLVIGSGLIALGSLMRRVTHDEALPRK